MCDGIDHSGDCQEPGSEKCERARRSNTWDRDDPDKEPCEIEDNEERHRHGGEAQKGTKAFGKTGRRFFREVNGLHSRCQRERAGCG